ncbi:MAG: cytochrome c oxidase subunit II [Ignavibacteria bacterium]|nr:MAG: cytochrome c oxidase subunit II [Ignavibacteria bacterium]
MFPGPSNTVEAVDSVMFYIVAISVILLLGITITMIYFVFKYNRKKGHKPVDIHGSVLLETIWIAIPTLLVLSMFYYGYMGFKTIRNIPDNAYKIKTTAQMWKWNFEYENGVAKDTLYVPVDTPILLEMESIDVNHSLYIPAFRIKEDVIAGKINYLSFTPSEIGDYDIACAEYCGLNHSMMYTKVVVLPKQKFNEWLKNSAEKK